MRRLIYLLCVLLVVPALGWAAAGGIEHSAEAANSCTFNLYRRCHEIADTTRLLRSVSLGVGGAGLTLPLVFWVASLAIGSNRRRLALVFPALVRLSLAAMAAIVVAQVGIVLYATYLSHSYAETGIPLYLPVAISIGGLFVCAALLQHALTLGGRREVQVAGKLLERATHPRAYALVDGVAQRLGARSPDNIVVGLEATFFATSAKVRVLDRPQPLEGETLFLSLPFSRALSAAEIAAVIGHELGHFRGQDTIYSLRFAPVYVGLEAALRQMAQPRDWGIKLAAMPASALVAFMLEVFSRNESRIGRQRELEADRAAIEVASVQDFEAALVKAAAFAPVWAMCQAEDAERLRQGLATQNLSVAFADCIRFDLDREKLAQRMDEMLQTRIAHPTDSHPTIAERLAAVGGRVTRNQVVALLAAVDGAEAALGDLDAIERELTALRHKLLIDAGVSTPPATARGAVEEQQRAILEAAYALAAAIVAADGRWTATQLIAAGQGPDGLALPFSRIDLRERCRNLNGLDAATAARMLAAALTEGGRNAVLDWLWHIAHAELEPSPAAVARYREIEWMLTQGRAG